MSAAAIAAPTLMDVSVDRATLLSRLQLCAGVVEKRSTIPILSNVKLETRDGQLRIVATDMEITVVTSLAASRAIDGSVTIEAAILTEIIKRLSSDSVNLTVQDNLSVRIVGGTAQFDLPVIAADDFPLEPTADDRAARSIPSALLVSLIHDTNFAMDGTSPTFGGTYAKLAQREIKLYGTDGKRMAIASAEIATGPAAEGFLPIKFVQSISRLAADTDDDVSLSFGDNHISASSGNTTMYGRRVDYSPPDYDAFVPKTALHRVRVRREDITKAIRRVLIVADERNRAMRLTFSRGRLTIAAKNPERGLVSEFIPIEFSGDETVRGQNGLYLAQAVEIYNEETIVVDIAVSPMNRLECLVVRPESTVDDDSRVCVVMGLTIF